MSKNISSDKLLLNEENYLLLGTPNVGKSTFFNMVSTSTAAVSNIDRMTVEENKGNLKYFKNISIIDLPGIYNLSHPIDEEVVVAQKICEQNFTKIINIVSASTLERDLLLTIQCLETGLLSTLVVNMVDEINLSSLKTNKLKTYLNNVNLILTQANNGGEVKKSIKDIKNNEITKPLVLQYPILVEKAIEKITSILPSSKISPRFFAIMILENNTSIIDHIKTNDMVLWSKIEKILKSYKEIDFYSLINETRIKYIDLILSNSIDKNVKFLSINKEKQYKVDRQILKKWIGIPAFILMFFIIYFISFGPYMGGSLKELIDDGFNKLLEKMNPQIWFEQMLVNGLLAGLFSVLSFIPTIAILFFFINFVQQIGIMSRVSALTDNTLDKFGLSGRSIVNVLTGLGCSVPAVMMARSSNSYKERFISILITPFITCSARIIVISYVCNLVFGPIFGWLGTILLVLVSGLIALSIGLIFSKTMFRKQKSFFLIEMVNWRKPNFMVIFKLIWNQIKSFLKLAFLFITLSSLVIWLLLHISPSSNPLISNDDEQAVENSLLGYFARGIQYIFYPLGFVQKDGGWKLVASLICSLPAKEIAIANLNILFGNNLSSYFLSNTSIAISYLVMTMAFLPCAATIMVIKKESSWRVVFIHMLLSFFTCYILATICHWLSFLAIGK